MYTTKTECRYCYQQFEVKDPDKDVAEKKLMQQYFEHINSPGHKRLEFEHRQNQSTKIVCKTTCQCGQVIKVESQEMRVRDATPELSRKYEKSLMHKLSSHRNTSSCKTIRKRDSKINSILN